MSNGNIRESCSSAQLASTNTFSTGHASSYVQDLDSSAIKVRWKMKNINMPTPTAQLYHHHPQLIPSFSLKRKCEVHEDHEAQPPPKVCLTWPPPKWEPPHPVPKREVNKLTDNIHAVNTRSLEVGVLVGENKERYNPKQIQPFQSSATWQPLKQAKEEANVRGPHVQLTANFLPTTLMFDPRVKDFGKLHPEEKMEISEMTRKARVLVLTLVYRDGTTQLDPEQVSRAPGSP